MKLWQSLAPGRAHPTPLHALVASVTPPARPIVEQALLRLCDAVEKHFPENIFVDLDALAHTLGETVRVDGGAAALEQTDRIVRLHSLFGGQTVIRFRYVHDFLYGFDWARWVARDPAARSSVGPFDRAFLAYSETRARELLALIARDDPKYGALEPKEHRNPFPFRRDPEAERTILCALAAESAIPVPAWCAPAVARWDLPYATLREEKALALGLAT